jgi:outer membrane protein OmpA-like peptidoglycan-associated protein/tetratricopeptide (TPR) repeat protein
MRVITNALIVVFVSVTTTVYSQTIKKYLDQGDKFYARQEFAKARKAYQEAEKIEPNDAKIQLKLGLTYLSSSPKFQSLNHLERAYKLNQQVDADIHYYLGLSNQLNFHFQKAQKHYELYKERNKRMGPLCDQKIEECQRADSLMNQAVSAIVKVMDSPLNSPFEDYGPLLNAAENKLIFTSARDSASYDKRSKALFEEILISELKDGVWSAPQKISSKINNQFHDAAASLSRDGNTLIIYYGEGSGDLYRSDFDGTAWSKPKSMGAFINGPISNETSGCFTPDGKKFYFSSDRPEGFGGLDIYVAEINQSGQWTSAQNLGPSINTSGNEDAPFMYNDSLLYFGSDGHPGLGNYDIFKAQRVRGIWQKPENMGYPVNTAEYENFFHLTEDKKRGYYASVRKEGTGRTDLCMVTFTDQEPKVQILQPEIVKEPVAIVEEKIEPAPVSDEFVDPLVSLHKDLGIAIMLKGKVIDTKTSAPLKAQIILINNENNTVVARIYSNATTGDFSIDIPNGGNYGINTSAEGYLFNSMNFDVPTFAEYQEIDTHILMVKAEAGSKVVLKNVFFDSGKATIKKQSEGELQRIVDLLNKNLALRLQVNGHTDSSGDNATNKALSLKRAQAVMDFLVKNGIDKKRLSAVGYGEERPLVSNDDEMEGREINRRTEIEILGG